MIVCHLLEAALISTLGLLLRWENQRRDRIQAQATGGLEGRDLDSTAFLDLTDRENLKYVVPSRSLCFTAKIVTASGISISCHAVFYLQCVGYELHPFITPILYLT